MINMRRNRDIDLERQYFTQVYKRQPNFQLNQNEYSSFLPKKQHSNYLQVNTDASISSTEEFSDESEIELIESHFKRLGIESFEVSALRNYSYLQSKENDCIESLLLKIQEPQSTEKVEEPKEAEIVKLKCGEQIQTNFRKFILYFTFENLSKFFKPIDFQSLNYLLWLAMVSIFYVYNIFSITIRYSFEYDKIESSEVENETLIEQNVTFNNFSNFIVFNNFTNYTNLIETLDESTFLTKSKSIFEIFIRKKLYWFLFDYTSDLIYLIDMFLIQTRIKFIKEGLWVNDLKSTTLNYFASSKFIVKRNIF